MNKLFDKYTVTETGQVINDETGYELKGEVNNCGYRRVMIAKKRYFVHRLVAQTYLPNPDNKGQVNHKDGNKLNNTLGNLEWNSSSENQRHRYDVLKKKTFGNANSAKTYSLIHPDGNLIEIHNMHKYCRDNNLSVPSLQRMLRGERTHYKGYKKP